jgi:hypothetical protein
VPGGKLLRGGLGVADSVRRRPLLRQRLADGATNDAVHGRLVLPAGLVERDTGRVSARFLLCPGHADARRVHAWLCMPLARPDGGARWWRAMFGRHLLPRGFVRGHGVPGRLFLLGKRHDGRDRRRRVQRRLVLPVGLAAADELHVWILLRDHWPLDADAPVSGRHLLPDRLVGRPHVHGRRIL